MTAYLRNKRAMESLGITAIKRGETVGNVTIWTATLTNGDILTANQHRMGNESGALRSFAAMLKRNN